MVNNIDELAWAISLKDFYIPKRQEGSPRIFITFDFRDFAFTARSNNWEGNFSIRVASSCCYRELIFANTSRVRRMSEEEQALLPVRCSGCLKLTPYNKFDLSGNVIAHVSAKFYDSMEAIVVEEIITRSMLKVIGFFRDFALELTTSELYKIKYLETLAQAVSGKLSEIDFKLVEQDFIDAIREGSP